MTEYLPGQLWMSKDYPFGWLLLAPSADEYADSDSDGFWRAMFIGRNPLSDAVSGTVYRRMYWSEDARTRFSLVGA